MSVSNMLKLLRMLYPATCLNAIRNFKTRAERIIQWNKDEYKAFGPLLKKKGKKAQRKQTVTNSVPSLDALTDGRTNGHFHGDSERAWALNVRPERILIKKREPKLGLTKINQQSIRSLNNEKIERDPDDATEGTNATAYKEKNLALIIESIKNASIIHTSKSDVDKWASPEILSLSPIDQYHSLPGVTRILNESMSEKAKLLLENWKKRMILELGVEGFETYQRDLLHNSKIMHSLIEDTLKNEPVNVPDHLQLTYKSISSVLKDIKDVRFIESHVVHPTLGYRGYIDCIAEYKGNLCVIDWKKSDKSKTLGTMYDSPLQISAYIGALNSDENYSFKVKTGLLAIAYAHGQPPSVFELSGAKLEFYWKEWLKRLEKYYAMRYS